MHLIALKKHKKDSFFVEKYRALKVKFCFTPYPNNDMIDYHFWVIGAEEKRN